VVSAPAKREALAHNAAETMIADTNTPARSPGIRILLQISICGVCCHKKAQKAQKSFCDICASCVLSSD
jgi:hypothetical protein